jgi:hypothetical protein
MTRTVIALALASGIAPDIWWEQDVRSIITAVELLEERNRQNSNSRSMPRGVTFDEQGRQMSG